MSRVATDWAWQQELKTSSLKLLLLAMADRADEDHCCFPSVARLVKDTGLNEKTVGTNMRKLETLGYLSDTGRRKGITGKVKVYRINGVENFEKINKPEIGGINESAPMKASSHKGSRGEKFNTPKSGSIGENGSFNTPENGSLNTPKNGSLNTPKNGSQNQSLEPVIEPFKNTAKNSLDFSSWPVQPSEQVLLDWVSYRKKKKLSVSQTVINRLATELNLAHKNGVSVDDCLSECVVRGWQGFEYAWLSEEVRVRAKANVKQMHQTTKKAYSETGVINEQSSRKDVSEALLAGYSYRDLPKSYRDDLLNEWRVGRLPVKLITALEHQGVAL